MSNTIKIKRGSSVPSSSDLENYELGYRTGTTELYINDGGNYRQLGGTTNTGTVDTSGSPVDNDFAKFTDANTIEGRSIAETQSDLGLGDLALVDSIAANKVVSGTFATARIPSLAASKITSGTFNIARIPTTAIRSNYRLSTDASNDTNNASTSGIYRIDSGQSNVPGGITYGTLVTFNNLSDTGFQIVADYHAGGGSLYWRGGNSSTFSGTGSSTSWFKIWNEDNDGSGSGLDADTLDGSHASSFLTTSGTAANSTLLNNLGAGSFLRSDANDTASGVITFSNRVTSTGTDGFTIGNYGGYDRIVNNSNVFRFLTDGDAYANMQFATVTAGTWQGTAIASSYIADNSITAAKLYVSGNGTNGQVLKSDGDGTFSWFSLVSSSNASTLDNLDSTQFLRSDTGDTAAGNITFTGKLLGNTNTTSILNGASVTNLNTAFSNDISTGKASGLQPFRYSNSTTNTPLGGSSSMANNANWGLNLYSHGTGGTGNYGLQMSGGDHDNQLFFIRRVTNGSFGSWFEMWHSGNDGSGSGLDADTVDGIQASSFLRSDANDTCSGAITFTNSAGIYINDANTNLDEGNGDSLRVTTDSGWLEVGSQNSSWGHIQTDRPKFYFNKQIAVDTGIISSYDEDLSLRRVHDSSADRIDITADYSRIIVNNTERFRATTTGATITGHAYATSSYLAPDGSATTPAYRFNNDGNTGMLLSGTDTIGFSTGGSTRFTMNSGGVLYVSSAVQAGNGGIQIWDGTHGFKQVLGKDSTYTYLKNNDGLVGLHLGDTGDGQNYYSNGAHRFRSASDAYYATLNSTGLKLGTGYAQQKLDVAGNVAINGGGATKLYIDGEGAGYHQGAIIFRGTATDASYRGQGMYHHDAASDIEYFTGTLYANDAWAVTRKTSTASHDDSVAQGSHALLIVEGGGDVGIGLSNPTEKLHVSGNIKSTGHLILPYGEINDGGTDFVVKGTNAFVVQTGGANNRYIISNSGNHGIYGNTDFSSPMTVQYGVTINEGGHDSDTRIESDGNANMFRVDASTNRIGIGTGSPTKTLHVEGSTRLNGDTIVGPNNNNSKAFIRANNGYSAATTPDYTWYYNDQCGIFHPAGNVIGFSAGGEKARITSQGLTVTNGSVASPSLSFTSDTNTGIYRKSEDYMAFVASGYERFAANGNGLDLSGGSVNKIVMPGVVSRDKYRVWNSSYYTIGMDASYTFGGIGSDYVMTFQMNDSATRGFWWGDDQHPKTQGAMALTTNGKLTVAHSVRLGYGEGDTTTPGGTASLEVKGSGTGLAGYFENTSSNGTVMQLKTTGDNKSLYLQTDHIYASGELYLGHGDQYTRYRGANHTWQLTSSNTTNMTLNSNQLLFAQPVRIQFANDQRIFDDGGGGLKVGAEAHKLQLFAGSSTQEIRFLFGGRSGTEKMRFDGNGNGHFVQDVVAYSSTPSDIRLKKNFTKIDNGLDVISKLDGQTFNWKKDEGRLSAGFKAQEVEKVLPHLVNEKKLPLHSDDDKDYKVLRYEELIPYLVEAIKEQQVQIDELKTKLGE